MIKSGFIFMLVFGLLGGSSKSWARDAKASFTMQNLEPGQLDSNVSFQPVGGRYTGGCGGTVEETWGGITTYNPAACTGTYLTHSSRLGSRAGFRFDSFLIMRSLLSIRQFTIVRSSGNCPNSLTNYNYLILRGRSKNDFVGPMDFSSASTWAGGSFTYSNSSLTGTSRFSLAELSAVSQSTNGFAYESLNSGCASGEWSSVTSDMNDAPFSEYAAWQFGNTLAVSISSGGNPVVVVGAPVNTLSTVTSFWQGKNKSVYSGLMTYFNGRNTQDQKNVYLSSDSSGRSFSISEASSLSDTSQRASLGTLNCSTLNSPSNGFCSGTLAFASNPTATGNAVCLFSFDTGGKDLLFCAAQNPGDTTRLVTFLGGTSAVSRISVAANPLHLTSVQTSGNVLVTVTNLTARPVSTLSPDSLIVEERLAAPFTPLQNSNLTGSLGSGGFITGSNCGTSLPAYSSCTIQVSYSPASQRLDKQTFRLPYDKNVTNLVNATTPLFASRGLSSLSVSAADFTVGSSSQATVTATFADGSTQDVTALVDLASSNSSQLPISSSGTVTAPTGAGSTTLTGTFGTVSATRTVTAFTAAPNPTNFTATAVSASQINLSWSSGGTGTVNYQIAYQTGATAPATCNAGTVIAAATQGSTTTRSVTGLASSTQYSFRVCATNGAGTLTAGVTASATTTGGSIPGAPTNVTGTINNAQVALSWAAPASDGGSSITDYVIQYSSEGYTTQPYTLSQSSNYSDSCSSNTASSLYDGNLGNGSGTSSSSNEFVRADLGSSMTVARIRLSPLSSAACGWGPSYLNGKTLQYSTDGTNWTTYATISGVTDGAYKDYLPDISARYWRIQSSSSWLGVGEFVIQTGAAGSWTTFNDGTSTATSATITGLANGTAYIFRVAAVNGIGTGSYSSNSASLTPLAIPSAPTSVAGVAGNGQVALTWAAPASNGGSAITDYAIQFSSNSGTSWTTFNDGTSTATSATVTGLVNGTTYIFRVAAVNSSGTGSYSSNSGSVTPAATTPGAPTSVAGTIGNTQVALTWAAPSSNGGSAITDYAIQFSSNSGTSWSTFSDGTSTATSTTVTGLVNGTAYIFRVAAVNGVGTGSYSSNSASLTPTNVTVPGAPTSVAGTIGNTQVALTWAAPSSNGGSAITDYAIQFSSNSGTSWSTFSDGTSTATSTTVTGLVNGTAYIFRVAAVNAAGTGSYSANSASVTPGSVPGAPTAVVGNAGNTSVPLTWRIPSSNGGSAITDYAIQFSSNSGTSWTTFDDGTSTATSTTVTGLVNGTAYIFRVAAVNAAGTGSYSTNSTSVTPTAPAATVHSVVVFTAGSSTTVPNGVTSAKIWVIGGGGGGAGATSSDGTSGGGGGAGGIAFRTFTVAAGQSISYSLGAGGAGGINTASGTSGTATSATVGGVTIQGLGGTGGFYNSISTAAGGSFSGGDGGATGGSGPGVSGDAGGGSGGAIGAVAGTTNGSQGSHGANSADVSGLFSALGFAQYAVASGGSASLTNSSSTSNLNHGLAATGFGCGGGSAGYWGGDGGAGRLGGGGGGASGYSASQTGGAGGAGAVVIQFSY